MMFPEDLALAVLCRPLFFTIKIFIFPPDLEQIRNSALPDRSDFTIKKDALPVNRRQNRS
jgi:hypothetical protein